jgi:pSer/pThr/pTyr-binding forkhead associated (FHA) protein
MTFGSNPQQASCVLAFPGIDELHARLYVDPQGNYILLDAGSVAGTWVNYCPVPQSGVRLEHGDLVHFAQAAFRFELAAPAHVRQPQVELYQEQ